MKNQDFTTTLEVAAAPGETFSAINNVRGWWSENIDGPTDRLNTEFSYHYEDVHRTRFKITEFVPGQKVVWHVLDNYFKFIEDKNEWVDTEVIFEISEKDGRTRLKFTHKGLVPDYECYKVCHDAWTHYVQVSLKELIEKGKGRPTPKETPNVESGSAGGQYPEASETSKEPGEASTGAISICQRLLIESPAEKVYEALTMQDGLAGWWTPEVIAKPEIGSVSRFSFGPDYSKEMKVEELKPYSKVKWLCLKAQEEWIGTTITFELEPHAKGTVLFFHHDKWKAYTPEFAGCSYAWALFFRSLKLLCETGKGKPWPEFDK